MRSIWSGAIGFGLVYIPVRMFNASESQELAFNLLRRSDGCRIRYTRICDETGEEVPYEDVVRGYEYDEGKWVVLEEDDFRRANVRKTQTIEIVGFIETSQIDLKYVEKPFYLEPNKGAEAPYVLLREAVKRSGKAGIARFVLRTREHMGLLMVEGSALLLLQMRFASEVRPPEDLALPQDAALGKAEMDMAIKLIDALTVPWNPDQYHDTYTEDLTRLIREKIEGIERQEQEEEPSPAEVTDLYVRLSESVQMAQEKQHPRR